MRFLYPGFFHLLVALFISASLITIDSLGLIEARHALHSLLTPIERLAGALRNIQKTQDHLAELSADSPSPQSSFAFGELTRENALLRQLLGLSFSVPYTPLPANVIESSIQLGENYLVIDKGAMDGCAPNQTVVCGKYFIGRIDEVGLNSSRVELLGANTLRVAVYLPRSGFQGVLRPHPNGGLEIYYLPPRAAIQEGDLVYTSGLGGKFPRGLLAGVVSSAESIPGELFLDCLLTPSPDLHAPTVVAILLPPSPPIPPTPPTTEEIKIEEKAHGEDEYEQPVGEEREEKPDYEQPVGEETEEKTVEEPAPPTTEEDEIETIPTTGQPMEMGEDER